MPLVLALWRQRQGTPEFKARLVYRMSSSTIKATQRNLVSTNTNKNV